MGYRISLILMLVGILGGCETVFDPVTGQTETRLTLPFTAANAAAAEEQWRRCLQFRSESYCQRNLPGGRPIGASAGEPSVAGESLSRENDP
jgi:hypothetical protein